MLRQQPYLHFKAHKVLRLPRNLLQGSQSPAPAAVFCTSTVHRMLHLPGNLHLFEVHKGVRLLQSSQSTAIDTRSTLPGSQNAASTTKSAHQDSYCTALPRHSQQKDFKDNINIPKWSFRSIHPSHARPQQILTTTWVCICIYSLYVYARAYMCIV